MNGGTPKLYGSTPEAMVGCIYKGCQCKSQGYNKEDLHVLFNLIICPYLDVGYKFWM